MRSSYTGRMPQASISRPKRRQCCVLAAGALLGAVTPLRAQPGTIELRGFTENLAPMNYEEDGRAEGFGSELLRMIAGEAGLPLSIEVLPWLRAQQQAAAQRHTVLFSLTRTAERETQFQWVGPIVARRILLYRLDRRSDIKPTSLKKLDGLRVGVVRDSAAARQLLADGLRPDVDLEFAQDDAANLRKLMAGRMDLLVLLDLAAAWHLRRLGLPASTLQPVLPLDVDKSYWYGLPVDTDPALTRRLQEALDRLKRDGRYERLRLKHFG